MHCPGYRAISRTVKIILLGEVIVPSLPRQGHPDLRTLAGLAFAGNNPARLNLLGIGPPNVRGDGGQ
jgi:hypothetical protein